LLQERDSILHYTYIVCLVIVTSPVYHNHLWCSRFEVPIQQRCLTILLGVERGWSDTSGT